MFERSGDRRSTVLGLLTLVALAAVVAYFVLDDGDQREVTVERGNPLPELRAIDREDEHGADTVRAFLQGAVNCDSAGRALMDRLDQARGGERPTDVLARACGTGALPGRVTSSYDEDLGTWTIPLRRGVETALRAVKTEGRWEIALP